MRAPGLTTTTMVIAALALSASACSDDGDEQPAPTSSTEPVEEIRTGTTSTHHGLSGSCSDDAGDVEGGEDLGDDLRAGVDLSAVEFDFGDDGLEVTVVSGAELDVSDRDVAQVSLVLTDDEEVSYSVTLVHGSESVIVYELPGPEFVRELGLDGEVDLADEEASMTVPTEAFEGLGQVSSGRVLFELALTAEGLFLGDECGVELDES